MLLHASLTGSYKNTLPQLYEAISSKGEMSLKGWMKSTDLLARDIAEEKYPHIYVGGLLGKHELHDDCVNKVKGDCLEILAEIFFNLSGAINPTAASVRDYKPCNAAEDFGVDGVGLNANNGPVAVQVKYRSNPLDLISYHDIARTFADGVVNYGLDLTKPNSILLFTTSNDITVPCKKFFQEHTKILNIICYKDIDYFIKSNKGFWVEANRLIQDTVSNPKRITQ